MSRGGGRKAAAQAETVQAEGSTQEQDAVEQDQVASDPYDKLEGRTPEQAIASSSGASDDYPYFDKTSIPMHERDLPMTSVDGPSQSDLNPAFTPKPEDGGPSKEQDEAVIEGTEPNANDKALAAAENSGQEGAVEAVEQSIEAGKDQQIDAAAVQADAEEKAPEGVDASTGNPKP